MAEARSRQDIPAEKKPLKPVRNKPDPGHDPLGEVGWYLQRERVKRGQTLIAAGRACGVDPIHLAALEQGDVDFMPRGTQVFSIIGAYAQHLGFEPAPLLSHYRQALRAASLGGDGGNAVNQTIVWFGDHVRNAGSSIRQHPGPSVAGFLAAIIIGLAGMFGFGGSGSTPSGEQIAQAPAPAATSEITGSVDKRGVEPSRAAPKPAATIASPRKEQPPVATPVVRRATGTQRVTARAQVPPLPDVRISEKPLSGDNGKSATVSQNDKDRLAALIERDVVQAIKVAPAQIRQQSTQPKVVTPSIVKPRPAPRARQKAGVFGQENGTARLVLTAIERVWIRVEDRDGKILFAKVVNPGDSYRVPNQPGLVLVARNAGALDYTVDGVAKGRLGNPGEIVIGLPLDIKKLSARKGKS